jgi:hypothetical protein
LYCSNCGKAGHLKGRCPLNTAQLGAVRAIAEKHGIDLGGQKGRMGSSSTGVGYAAYLAEHDPEKLARDKVPIPDGFMLVKIDEYARLKQGICDECEKRRRKKAEAQAKWRQKKRRRQA